MKLDGTFSTELPAKNTQEIDQISEKIGELTISDAEKNQMELLAVRLENVELQKQLKQMQAEILSLNHTLFTSEEKLDFDELKDSLESIKDDLRSNIEYETDNVKTQLDELYEQFVMKYDEAEFGDTNRGKILSDIRDRLHCISSNYDEILAEIQKKLDEMETIFDDVITIVENLVEVEDVWPGKIIDNPMTNNSFNGSTNAQPKSNILVNRAANLAQIPSTWSYHTSFAGNYLNNQPLTGSANSYIQANQASTSAQTQSMHSMGGVNRSYNFQPNVSFTSSYVQAAIPTQVSSMH